MSIYAFEKSSMALKGTYDTIAILKSEFEKENIVVDDYKLLKDMDMKYISRITYVDGDCVYNNKDFWLGITQESDILINFASHEVLDFNGQPVTKKRFEIELANNKNRLNLIDGIAGQIDYNQEIGQEFIDIFREICILTDFKAESGITPLLIAQKLSSCIALVQTGSFREAKQVLMQIQATSTDAFLTTERLQMFMDMLDAADVIEYATDEDYYYTVPEDA